MGRVVVVGAVYVWVRAYVEALPEAGETVTAMRALRTVGGRGVTKALLARRAGAEVVMVGAVGDDHDGDWCARQLVGLGIEARLSRVPGATTGLAVGARLTDGSTATILMPDDSSDVSALVREALVDLRPDDVVLVDLDNANGVVGAVVSAADRQETRVVLSASPYAAVPVQALEACSPCVFDERDAAALADTGALPQSLCVVFGGAGAVWDGLRVQRRSDAQAVPVREDVLAGPTSDVDRFSAALAAALASDPEPESALRRAVVALADGRAASPSTSRRPQRPSQRPS